MKNDRLDEQLIKSIKTPAGLFHYRLAEKYGPEIHSPSGRTRVKYEQLRRVTRKLADKAKNGNPTLQFKRMERALKAYKNLSKVM